jgi:hypothetical protein
VGGSFVAGAGVSVAAGGVGGTDVFVGKMITGVFVGMIGAVVEVGWGVRVGMGVNVRVVVE